MPVCVPAPMVCFAISSAAQSVRLLDEQVRRLAPSEVAPRSLVVFLIGRLFFLFVLQRTALVTATRCSRMGRRLSQKMTSIAFFHWGGSPGDGAQTRYPQGARRGRRACRAIANLGCPWHLRTHSTVQAMFLHPCPLTLSALGSGLPDHIRLL